MLPEQIAKFVETEQLIIQQFKVEFKNAILLQACL
jgi:hypothetical protein